MKVSALFLQSITWVTLLFFGLMLVSGLMNFVDNANNTALNNATFNATFGASVMTLVGGLGVMVAVVMFHLQGLIQATKKGS